MGWLVGVDGAGLPLVEFEGNRRGPLAAGSTLPLEPEALLSAVARRQGVLLLFKDGDPLQPLIVGWEPTGSPTPMLDALLEAPGPEPAAEQPEAPPVEAQVDGQRVVIRGADEVVLRCGHASITLRRNGRIVIRGTLIESHSTGVQRIKGSSVQVN